MTAPTEPSVEASEALARVMHPVLFMHPDEAIGPATQMRREDALDMAHRVIAAGYVSPADHERAVSQARAEGAAEALREAADAMPSSITARGDEKPISSVYAARIWLRNRADNLAQPEDARDGEQK